MWGVKVKRKLSIISLGWMGTKVYSHFENMYICSGSFNSKSKGVIDEFFFDINNFDKLPESLKLADIVFFNIPPSRVIDLKSLNNLFEKLLGKRVILVSSTSVYEGSGTFDEGSQLNPISDRAKKQIDIENALKSIHDDYLILRCAGLYGEDRHPGYFLSGKENVSGQYLKINLIGINDILKIMENVLDKSEVKLLNLVNSNHPIKKEYYNNFCKRFQLKKISFNDDLNVSSKVIETKYDQFKINSKLP